MRRFPLVATLVIAAAVAARAAVAQEPVDTREVSIGLLLVDLSGVDGAKQSFSADVFLLATWHDPALVGGQEARTLDLEDVWHPTLVIFNRRSVDESMPNEVTVRPDGTVSLLRRYTGTFSSPMNLREFPRDRQEFFIWVVSPSRVGIEVTLVPDRSIAALRVADLSIPDWDVGEPVLDGEAFQLAPGAPINTGVRLRIPASRLRNYYRVQVVIPFVVIVMMAYAVFWIAPAVVPTRVGVVVTTMLTLIAYRFMLANLVPRLSYLTRLDWFMLGGTVLVITTLFTMAGTSYLVNRDREGLVLKIDRAGRVLYPVVFAGYTLIVWLV